MGRKLKTYEPKIQNTLQPCVESISSPQINGKWCVRDCMNKRYKNSIDFLIDPINNKPKLGVCEDVRILNGM